jgi:predicted transcriptional regulator
MDSQGLLVLAADIVSAFLGHNRIEADALPELIQSVHRALATAETTQPEPAALSPAVPPRQSVKPDHIVCLEDGLKFKSLRRHLTASHNLTPETYRARWGLAPDYPMVAPGYAALRSEMAKRIGLGMRRAEPVEIRPARGGKRAKTVAEAEEEPARETRAEPPPRRETAAHAEPAPPARGRSAREPTAASVFANFSGDAAPPAKEEEEDMKALADIGGKRKPFAKQSARGMRTGKPASRR